VSQDWLLIETLGEQPAVVAQGRQMKNFVPLTVFLRRNPHLGSVSAAITATVTGRTGLALGTADGKRMIRTEPVVMTDGRIHGVHLWYGPSGAEAPERPLPGAWRSNLELTSSLTPQFLLNIGRDPAVEPLDGRSIADDIPVGDFNPGEAEALSWAVDLGPGRTFAANWGFRDPGGLHRRVGFCIRIRLEAAADGTEHLVGRSMNVLESVSDAAPSTEQLAQRVIDGMARPGVHRAIIDLDNWTLIKWLDAPCPFYDWRAKPQLHPEDQQRFSAQIREELAYDQTSVVLRLPSRGGGWTPVHVTINRIELDRGVFAGLVALRRPTGDELAAAGTPGD